MKALSRLFALAVIVLGFAGTAHATIIPFSAILSGANEVPSNTSPGFGIASVMYDDVVNTLDVFVVWTNLTTGNVTGHIHCCGPEGTNAPVHIPFGMLPGAGGSFSSTFNIGADLALVTGLLAGNAYVDLHTPIFPAGEIRGQLTRPVQAVAEPSSLALFALALG